MMKLPARPRFNPLSKNRWAALIFYLAALIGSGHLLAAKKIGFRGDLRSALSKHLCHEGLNLSPRTTWQLGVFDGQASGAIIQSDKGSLSTTQVKNAVVAEAYRLHHNSGSFGRCAHNKAWIVTTPAPSAIQREGLDRFSFSKQQLRRHCRRYRFDYSAGQSGKTRRIRQSSHSKKANLISLDLSLLSPGTLTVTCFPREPQWLGPVTWYMIPVKDGPPSAPPFQELLTDSKRTPSKRMYEWLNSVREKEALPRLVTASAAAMTTAKRLAPKNHTLHDRRLIKAVRSRLTTKSIKLIGENKAMGNNLEELGWLLWNSPRHRNLLLSKKATSVAFYLTQEKAVWSLTMVMLDERHTP